MYFKLDLCIFTISHTEAPFLESREHAQYFHTWSSPSVCAGRTWPVQAQTSQQPVRQPTPHTHSTHTPSLTRNAAVCSSGASANPRPGCGVRLWEPLVQIQCWWLWLHLLRLQTTTEVLTKAWTSHTVFMKLHWDAVPVISEHINTVLLLILPKR